MSDDLFQLDSGFRRFQLADGSEFRVDVFEASAEAAKLEQENKDAGEEALWNARMGHLNRRAGLGTGGKRSCTRGEALAFVKTVIAAADALFKEDVEIARPFAGSRIGTAAAPTLTAPSVNGS